MKSYVYSGAEYDLCEEPKAPLEKLCGINCFSVRLCVLSDLCVEKKLCELSDLCVEKKNLN